MILIILISFIGIYISFIYGLKLNNLDMYGVNIEKLYIKIDKKFIIRGENISIHTKKSNSKTDFKKINSIMVEVFKWLPYFQEIDIKSLKVSNQNIKLINYKDNTIIYDTDISSLKAKIYPNINKTKFNIEYVNIKPLKETFKNINGYYIPKLSYIDIHTTALLNEAKIKSNIEIYEDKLNFKANINNITDIKIYKKFIPENYHLYVDNVNFKNINVDNINLTYKFSPSKTQIKDITLSIYKIGYEKNKIEKVKLYINRHLDINMQLFNSYINAYNTISNIDKSILHFTSNKKFHFKFENLNSIVNDSNFFSNSGVIDGDLQGNIDSKIEKLNIELKDNSLVNLDNIELNGNYNNQLNISTNKLKYTKETLKIVSNNINSIYKIKDKFITIKKIKGLYKTAYNKNFSTINLKNLSVSHKNDLKVSFNTNALLSKNLLGLLKEFKVSLPIYQQKADNNIFVNMNMGEKFSVNIDLNTSDSILNLTENVAIDVKKAELSFRDSIVKLKNTEIDFNQSVVNFNYDFNSTINLSKKFMELNGTLSKVNLENILELNNFKENVYINLNNLNIDLKNLSTKIAFNPLKITIDKISKYTPYYKLLEQFNINEGFSNIVIDKNITISAYVSDTNQSIVLKNSKSLKEIASKIVLVNDKKIIETKDLKAIITGSNHYDVNIKNIDINVTKFLDNPKDKNRTTKDKNISKEPIFAKVNATNSSIIYKNFKLYSKSMNVDLKDKNMTFVSLNDDNNITGIMTNGDLKIYGINIDKKTIQNVTENDTIKDILLNFLIIKYDNSEATYGFVELKRGYIEEMMLFNNIIAFINTVPSLVTFSSLGYSTKGFKIRKGYIDFIQYQNYIYFKKIYMKGDNMSFKGHGYIDLKNEKIKMNLDVNILVKLVKDIPLVGYILLGKDGGITLRITVDGDMKNPTIHKNTLQNIIESPFGLIYRTITSPFNIINSEEE
jgi:hypothetical protein